MNAWLGSCLCHHLSAYFVWKCGIYRDGIWYCENLHLKFRPSLQWNVTWCSLVVGYWHFGTVYCFPSPMINYQQPSFPEEWSPQLHHSRSLKSYTKSYYGKLLLASEASERHGYCTILSPPPTHNEGNRVLAWDIKYRSYKDFGPGWWAGFFIMPAWPHLLWASSKVTLLPLPNASLQNYAWLSIQTLLSSFYVFLIWYTVHCLHFSLNCVTNSSLLRKPAMYKNKLEEKELCRTDKGYSLLLRFVLLQICYSYCSSSSSSSYKALQPI